MHIARRLQIILLVLAPTFVQGQDIIHVEVAGIEHLGWGANFGVTFPQPGTNIGPLPIVPVVGAGFSGLPEEGCDSYTNSEEVEGNIALVLRGSCLFVRKVLNAVEAGAEAVVVYNDWRPDDEDVLEMSGDCGPDACSVPAVFTSRSSGHVILQEIASGPTEATLIPIQVETPVASETVTPESTFALDAVYPNPLASQATIGFTLPTAQDVRLAVYDVLGREVAVLADGVRAAGEQSVAFDASALPSGVYLVRLEAGAVRLVERVTVVR